MKPFAVPGLKEALETTDTTPRTGFTPFPAAAPTAKWGLKHTARIDKVDLFVDEANGNDKIVAEISNGDHKARIYTQIDPSIVSPATVTKGSDAVAEAVDRNTRALALAAVTYGVVNEAGMIDPKLFPKSAGKLVTITVKDSGKVNANGYPTLYVNLLGRADELRPVDQALAGLASAVSRPAEPSVNLDADIPF